MSKNNELSPKGLTSPVGKSLLTEFSKTIDRMEARIKEKSQRTVHVDRQEEILRMSLSSHLLGAADGQRSVHSEIEAAFIQQLTDRHAVAEDVLNETAPLVFNFQPTPSNVNAAAHGTVHRIPNGLTRSMEEEFRGSAFEEDYNYVVYGKACDTPGERKWKSRQNCIRDEGHEGWTLQDFMTRPETKRIREAGLTMAEVAMLRLYPTAAWMLNAILRQQEKGLEQWATSISILTSAIIKLSADSPLHPVYRAIPNAVVDGGVADGLHSCGLVHFDDAFSSTTQKAETLLNYAGDPNTPAVVFCIDSSWSCRVAALRELSQYPQEDEYLLPPCISLEITRVVTVGRKKLLHCTPHMSSMRHYTDNLLFPWSSPCDPLTGPLHYARLQRHCSDKSSQQKSWSSSLRYGTSRVLHQTRQTWAST
jgi:hypothetical protein